MRKPNKNNKVNTRFTNTVIVKDGNFEHAMRVFKRRTKKSNIRQECKDRMFFTKPSEKRRIAKKRAVRRQFLISEAQKKFKKS